MSTKDAPGRLNLKGTKLSKRIQDELDKYDVDKNGLLDMDEV